MSLTVNTSASHTCPDCGEEDSPHGAAILAVCDVLTVRALEVVGKRIVRAERSRMGVVKTERIPSYQAHCRWRPDQGMVNAGLRGAWDVVPVVINRHGCGIDPERVRDVLDIYVRDLLITGMPHTLAELQYRLAKYLQVEAEPCTG